MGDAFTPPLEKERHLRYWQRCVRSPLPYQYTSNDSIRMTLGFFIVAAVDLLSGSPADTSSLPSKTLLTSADRRRLRDWVLACQHSGGGFCGSPTHALPKHEYDGLDFLTGTPETGHPGEANVAATSFALLLLALLTEDGSAEGAFASVDRVRTLQWLRRLQREDGSFGEVLVEHPAAGENGNTKYLVAGGRDMRYCYLAAMVRWMLRGDVREGEAGWLEDIDVDGLVAHIRRAQIFDGGMAEGPREESHAGYGYCAVAALSLLDRPAQSSAPSSESSAIRSGIAEPRALAHWLISRQFVYLEHVQDGNKKEEDDDPETSNFTIPASLESLSLEENLRYSAFNGRVNKVADSCYTWWVSGALALLGHSDLLPQKATRAFLLDKMQHAIGGFSKHVGSPPDVYHGYLGLASLATMGDPALREFDPALCVSVDVSQKIIRAREVLLGEAEQEKRNSGLADSLLEMSTAFVGGRPAWLKAES